MGTVELGELLRFVRQHNQPKVQLLAVRALAELSASDDGFQRIAPTAPDVCAALSGLLVPPLRSIAALLIDADGGRNGSSRNVNQRKTLGGRMTATETAALKALINISATFANPRGRASGLESGNTREQVTTAAAAATEEARESATVAALLGSGIVEAAWGALRATATAAAAVREVEKAVAGVGTREASAAGPPLASEAREQGKRTPEEGGGGRGVREDEVVEEEEEEEQGGDWLRRQQRLLLMLLANLTQREEGALQLLHLPSKIQQQQGASTAARLERSDAPQQAPTASVLLQIIQLLCADTSADGAVTYDHAATVVLNLTQTAHARKALLTVAEDDSRGDGNALRLLLKEAKRCCSSRSSSSSVRRQGVMGAIRNVCFDAGKSLATLLLSGDVLWPALLLPLAGPKAYSAEEVSLMPRALSSALSTERPPFTDAAVKTMAADAVFLIASHDGGRRALWGVQGHVILQRGYEEEDNEEVNKAFERVGSLLVEGGGGEDDR